MPASVMPSRRCLGSAASLSSCEGRRAACMTRLTRSMTGSGASTSQARPPGSDGGAGLSLSNCVYPLPSSQRVFNKHLTCLHGWQKTETPLPERKKPVAIIHHLQPPTNNGGIIKHSTQGRLANETEGAAAGADIMKNLVARRAVYLSLRFRHLSSSLNQRSWPQWGGYQEDII
eukprot:scaffold10206_cov63-Phaeocystis_antarctica.AAC.3